MRHEGLERPTTTYMHNEMNKRLSNKPHEYF